MPRGKRTVYSMTCSTASCGRRVGTLRLHRQDKKGKSWKEHKRVKYCPGCRKKTAMKVKEEKHSN
ncbi:hypothetical protein COU77_00755 [Candidatus Peregrinibacteria bacterium CG10_big_fil_rev_8_21_14_0_10_49_16]|nr:MAG: hypothetical protein COW95_03015 [Candidatus Peregrinibacteria bacterium CG22_combo_CG10-13_8_21_14_all_49_11]PIR52356.1 MAG: hypothetical protein COU77_00755 [Candidatus Peregrinibacteria bacterium CG10_big_fil_rev_8_21_14_0_10_49_16]